MLAWTFLPFEDLGGAPGQGINGRSGPLSDQGLKGRQPRRAPPPFLSQGERGKLAPGRNLPVPRPSWELAASDAKDWEIGLGCEKIEIKETYPPPPPEAEAWQTWCPFFVQSGKYSFVSSCDSYAAGGGGGGGVGLDICVGRRNNQR